MEAHSILAVILHVDLSHVIAWFDVALCQYNWHSAGSLGWTFPMLKHL